MLRGRRTRFAVLTTGEKRDIMNGANEENGSKGGILMQTAPKKRYVTTRVSSEEEFDRLNRRARVEDGLRVAIDTYPWGGDYRPESYALLSPDYTTGGLWVALETTEPITHIRTTAFAMDGPVWEDSCLEFFFNPLPEKGLNYLNFESNSAGTMLCGVHTDKINGQPGGNSAKTFRMRAVREYGKESNVWWQVRFFIPFDYIQKYFPDFSPRPGMTIAGNFYKCGDKCPKPHFAAWNFVEAPSPNFHVPASFGEIIL